MWKNIKKSVRLPNHEHTTFPYKKASLKINNSEKHKHQIKNLDLVLSLTFLLK